MPKFNDPEVNAMQTAALVLAPLSEAGKDRVVRWLYDRYILAKQEHQLEAGTTR